MKGKSHSLKDNKYKAIANAIPSQHMELPGQQGSPPQHGGDVLSMANVPQPGSPMTQLFANNESQSQ